MRLRALALLVLAAYTAPLCMAQASAASRLPRLRIAPYEIEGPIGRNIVSYCFLSHMSAPAYPRPTPTTREAAQGLPWWMLSYLTLVRSALMHSWALHIDSGGIRRAGGTDAKIQAAEFAEFVASRPQRVLSFLQELDPLTVVAVVDCHDLALLGTPEEALARFRAAKSDLVIGGERYGWPDDIDVDGGDRGVLRLLGDILMPRANPGASPNANGGTLLGYAGALRRALGSLVAAEHVLLSRSMVRGVPNREGYKEDDQRGLNNLVLLSAASHDEVISRHLVDDAAAVVDAVQRSLADAGIPPFPRTAGSERSLSVDSNNTIVSNLIDQMGPWWRGNRPVDCWLVARDNATDAGRPTPALRHHAPPPPVDVHECRNRLRQLANLPPEDLSDPVTADWLADYAGEVEGGHLPPSAPTGDLGRLAFSGASGRRTGSESVWWGGRCWHGVSGTRPVIVHAPGVQKLGFMYVAAQAGVLLPPQARTVAAQCSGGGERPGRRAGYLFLEGDLAVFLARMGQCRPQMSVGDHVRPELTDVVDGLCGDFGTRPA
ncbi:unnamed protein product [Pedinophyceae sp. YPF-701]|nr:unnamed protein product [Pedinophyceae sp. YPF-701]